MARLHRNVQKGDVNGGVDICEQREDFGWESLSSWYALVCVGWSVLAW